MASEAELYRLQRRVNELELIIKRLSRQTEDATAAKDAAESSLTRVFKLLQEEQDRVRHSKDIAVAAAEEAEVRSTDLRRRVASLEQELSETISKLDSERTVTHRNSRDRDLLTQARAKARQREAEITALRDENTAQHAAIVALETEVSRLNKQLLDAQAHNTSGTGPWGPEQQQLGELLAANRQLEGQVAAMSARLDNVRATEHLNVVLAEEKRSLRTRIDALTSIETQKNALSLRVADLEREQKQWSQFLSSKGSGDSIAPGQLVQQLGLLRDENQNLRTRLESVSGELVVTRKDGNMVALNEAILETANLRAQLSVQNATLDDTKVQLAVAEKQINVLQERIRLTSKSDAGKSREAYIKDLEETVARLRSDFTDASTRRAHENEIFLTSHKKENEGLLADARKVAGLVVDQKQELADAQQKANKLQKLNDDLSARIADAESQLRAVQVHPSSPSQGQPQARDSGFLVFEIDGSPYERQITAQLERLELLARENEQLHQIMAGRSNEGHGIQMVPLSTVSLVTRRAEELQAEVERKVRLEQRALEIFRAKAFEQYAARVDLLGYDLEIRPNRSCLARSSYALSDDLHSYEFVWDPLKKRYTDMSFTDSVEPHKVQYDYWIKQNNCPAGFLASVFLENFERMGTPPPRPQERMNDPEKVISQV